MKTVLLSGYYGFDNSGDDAILKAIIKDLKELIGDIEIIVLSNNPDQTKQVYGVEAVYRFSIRDISSAMKKSDLFISGGGSLLQDITSSRSLWYYLMTMELASLMRKPFMVYANGIGPIDRPVNRRLTRHVLNKAHYISLRDQDSYDYVKNLGVRNEKIQVTADPVFTLKASPKIRVKEIFKNEKIPMDKKLVGISVRKWEDDEKTVNSIVETIKGLDQSYDYNYLLIPMHHPEDLSISREIIQGLGQYKAYVLEDKYSVEDIMGVIRELDIILAMRLHALIYAATQNTPVVGLVYDPKLIGLIKTLSIENYVELDAYSTEQLLTQVKQAVDNRQALALSLAMEEQRQEDRALENIRIVKNILEGKI